MSIIGDEGGLDPEVEVLLLLNIELSANYRHSFPTVIMLTIISFFYFILSAVRILVSLHYQSCIQPRYL